MDSLRWFAIRALAEAGRNGTNAHPWTLVRCSADAVVSTADAVVSTIVHSVRGIELTSKTSSAPSDTP
jgi:hypothetical protein